MPRKVRYWRLKWHRVIPIQGQLPLLLLPKGFLVQRNDVLPVMPPQGILQITEKAEKPLNLLRSSQVVTLTVFMRFTLPAFAATLHGNASVAESARCSHGVW